ncbi:hypothetical protein FISHEDRAFT_75197 [Fistulina hepatica ATCC 64428]|uniref:USP domain-containing protein n=1 Tax=Fistulina hepatica ATCC 64428 TaxID=1128425 RepID=A0A0D7AAA2_9AGAR|nr:hypothetical protein FISHEDRAFT_75197 [Fistulina hepatica ATCC 64428]
MAVYTGTVPPRKESRTLFASIKLTKEKWRRTREWKAINQQYERLVREKMDELKMQSPVPRQLDAPTIDMHSVIVSQGSQSSESFPRRLQKTRFNSTPSPLSRPILQSDDLSRGSTDSGHDSGVALPNNKRRVSLSIVPPLGTSWKNNSCAYDCLFPILYSIWLRDPQHWDAVFREMNTFLHMISRGFERVFRYSTTLDAVRDSLRERLARYDPDTFPMGEFTDLQDILNELLVAPKVILFQRMRCPEHPNTHPVSRDTMPSPHNRAMIRDYGMVHASVSAMVDTLTHRMLSSRRCEKCDARLLEMFRFHDVPDLLVFEFAGTTPGMIDRVIQIKGENERFQFELVGVAYYGHEHYTCRIIDGHSHIWHHNAISARMEDEGRVLDEQSLTFVENSTAVAAFYTKRT